MKYLQKNILYIAWFQALIATLSSLIFSEILHYPPCVLCWYQRICMYPLVIIFGVGILLRDKFVTYYAWPLVISGWLIAVFHNLLYYNLLPESAAPCIAGISCTTKFFAWFGFITIPFLSLSAFSLIAICMLIYSRKGSQSASK